MCCHRTLFAKRLCQRKSIVILWTKHFFTVEADNVLAGARWLKTRGWMFTWLHYDMINGHVGPTLFFYFCSNVFIGWKEKGILFSRKLCLSKENIVVYFDAKVTCANITFSYWKFELLHSYFSNVFHQIIISPKLFSLIWVKS